MLLSLKMVKKTSDFVRGRVLEMYPFLKSSRKVSKNLAQEGILICSKTVNNIINAEHKMEKIFQQETEQKPWETTSPYKGAPKQSRQRHGLRQTTSSTRSGEEV